MEYIKLKATLVVMKMRHSYIFFTCFIVQEACEVVPISFGHCARGGIHSASFKR